MSIAPESLELKMALLDASLRSLGSGIVAFSGGADSALLLAAAVQALGASNVLAATSASDSLATGEFDEASRFSESLGVTHTRVDTREIERPGYVANGPDRCYHCKDELLEVLTALASQQGFNVVMTGTNADDQRSPHRPGLRAAHAHGVVTPLADAGFSKDDVRATSQLWNLPTWDKPQSACLASRIAYGVTVDPERLARIDRAEATVRQILAERGLDTRNLRVRDTGDQAVIEVDSAWVGEVSQTPEVTAAVLAAGFDEVTVDPRGFRSGSLNDILRPSQRIPGSDARSSWDLPIVD